MHLTVDWPSLADELELADVLFGGSGHELVASWLDDELSRVDDMEFARSFSDHIDLPGVHVEDYLHRRIRYVVGHSVGWYSVLWAQYQPPVRGHHRPQLR